MGHLSGAFQTHLELDLNACVLQHMRCLTLHYPGPGIPTMPHQRAARSYLIGALPCAKSSGIAAPEGGPYLAEAICSSDGLTCLQALQHATAWLDGCLAGWQSQACMKQGLVPLSWRHYQHAKATCMLLPGCSNLCSTRLSRLRWLWFCTCQYGLTVMREGAC